MRKSISIVTVPVVMLVVMLLVCTGNSMAQQMTDLERGNWLLGVIFKLERMRDDALADIQRYETGIRKADDIISRSENIIRIARQKGNAAAEKAAQDALIKAGDARQKNEELRRLAELRKKKAETAIANVRNLLAKMSSVKSEIKSVVTNHSGRVYIFKQNETIPLGESQAGYLEPGDRIWTLGNSSAEIQFLEGRGTIHLGEHSEFMVEEDDDGTEIINVIKGKIRFAIESMEKFLEWYEREIEKLGKELGRKLGGFNVRTANAIFGIRGTEFLVLEDEKTGTEILVLEGTVEVKAIKAGETFPVDAGYKIRVSRDGVISRPEKVDLTNIGDTDDLCKWCICVSGTTVHPSCLNCCP